MTKNNLLTIGELAKKEKLTVRTLQYYDQIDLLHSGNVNALSRDLLNEHLGKMEDKIREIMAHYMAIKNLAMTLEEGKTVRWDSYTHSIEQFRESGNYFWTMNYMFQNQPDSSNEDKKEKKIWSQEDIRKWHDLVGQVIYMSSIENCPSFETAKMLSEKYRKIENIDAIISEGISHHQFTGSNKGIDRKSHD